MASDNRKSKIVELNVGGRIYCTTIGTLMHEPSSILAQYFTHSLVESPSPFSVPPLGGSGPPVAARSRSPAPGPTGSPRHGHSSRQSIDPSVIQKRSDDLYFIDRDGDLFRFILDYLRSNKVILPDNFSEVQRLREEARFYKLNELLKQLKLTSPGLGHGRRGTLPALVNGSPAYTLHHPPHRPGVAHPISRPAPHHDNARYGYITVGYRGTFAFGRDGQADVKFRKLNRILVCGRATLCREVFGDSLNESRDPDRGGENRYTSRLYLKYNSLEMAFDTLAERGFNLVSSCASGTCASGDLTRGSTADSEEQKWNHYNEFIFYRSSASTMLPE